MTDPQDDFSTINRYWNDPEFAAAVDAEQVRMREINRAAWDAIGAKSRAKQEAGWATEATKENTPCPV